MLKHSELTVEPRIPVRLTTIPLGAVDPLACLIGLRNALGEDRVFALESLGGPTQDARSSLVGITGLLEASVYQSRLSLHGVPNLVRRTAAALLNAGVVVESPEGTLILADDEGLYDLTRVLDTMFDFERDPTQFGFGVLAFYGYDSVRYCEQLPRLIAEPAEPAPDAAFKLVQAIVSVDVNSGKAELKVANSDLWEPLDLAALVATAQTHLPNSAPPPNVPAPLGVDWDTNEATYVANARRCLEHIRVGDIYQVQIGHQISVRTEASELTVYRRLRTRNPSPYMSFIPIAGRTVIGASPELFIRMEGAAATMRPIAGTARRFGKSMEDDSTVARLLADPKERAEHVMLVDLCRNDLGRVSTPMSIDVGDLIHVEAYSHVFHLVSTVTSRLDPAYDAYDVIKACFPAGTMTGAPKVRAMEIIEEVEASRRGLYAGSFGLLGFGGPVILGLAIRMTTCTRGTYVLRASAGIVADSTPEAEWRETLAKMGATYWAVTGCEL